MSVDAFFKAVESETLRVLVRHWMEVRAARLMPGWSDLRPGSLRTVLPLLWSWKYDRESRLFGGRLAGDRIENVFGISFRGAPMTKFFSEQEYALIYPRFRRVVATPQLFRGHGLVYRTFDRFDLGERVILPVGDDGFSGDGIVGATDFNQNQGIPPDDVVRAGEIEEWFPLD